jgi:hypothetical protein
MERRDFLKTAIAAPLVADRLLDPLGAVALAAEETPQTGSKPADQKAENGMIYRPLDRTGERVSILGVGGYHIGGQKEEQESLRIIRSAIDAGITFMDNCWDYHLGGSEVRMGKALRDGYRDKAFLMTKIDGRTRDSAARQIDES